MLFYHRVWTSEITVLQIQKLVLYETTPELMMGRLVDPTSESAHPSPPRPPTPK
jgi:hypothetical protein